MLPTRIQVNRLVMSRRYNTAATPPGGNGGGNGGKLTALAAVILGAAGYMYYNKQRNLDGKTISP